MSIKCALCEKQAFDVADAIRNGWIPSYGDAKTEREVGDPVCWTCKVEKLTWDEEDGYVLPVPKGEKPLVQYVVVSSDGYETVRDYFDLQRHAEEIAEDMAPGADTVHVERVEVLRVVKGRRPKPDRESWRESPVVVTGVPK
jgi:hypothetical protein